MKPLFVLLWLVAGCGHRDGAAAGDGGAVADGAGSTGDGALARDDASATRDDAATDAATVLDGAPSDGPSTVPCGTTTCRDGQACVANACVYTCPAGALRVPQDFATVQEAVDLAESSAGGVVCLAARTFAEDVTIGSDSTDPIGPLTIIGVAADQTTLQSFTVMGLTTVTIEGLTTTQLSRILVSAATTASIVNCSLGLVAVQSAIAASVGTVTIEASRLVAGFLVETQGHLHATFDGDDISATAPGGYALTIDQESSIKLVVQNSYIHDSLVGLEYEQPDFASPDLTIVNTLFLGNGTAMKIEPAYGTTLLRSFNNLFVQNTLAASFTALVSLAAGNNALFGNATNYTGASVTATDVTADPLLDTTATPPTLNPGSPARGVASPAHAPAFDYWGAPRGSSPDIGPIQNP